MELIDYRHRHVYFRPNRSCMTLSQWLRDLRRYIIYEDMKKKHLITSNDHLISRDSKKAWEFIERQRYDLIVVGSDTILELHRRHIQQGCIPVYWLPVRIGCKKVMCAASARALTYEQLSDSQRKAFRESINNFDLIGVRDESTLALIRALGLRDEFKLQVVPDPTFVFEIDYAPIEKLLRERNISFSKPTVGLNLPGSFKVAAVVAAHYKSKGFQVLSLVPAKYGDISLTDISPFEWVGIYRYLCLVITDRFHGTLFSLKNLTPVVSVVCDRSLTTNDGLSKHYSLLRLFDLHESNFVSVGGLDGVGKIIKITDKAMCTFDKPAVKQGLTYLKNDFHTFVDKIVGLFD